jgi:phosphatidylserine/phosphatidylglycerophosphate/cardiolipin synthase-like enzyme
LTINGVPVETYFSPEDGQTIKERLIELVNQAQTSVRVMAFSFTIEELGQAMIDRFEDGVDVQAIFENRDSRDGQMRPMGCAGIPVKQDGNPSTFHHKVIVVDNEIVVTGSFNFSAQAIQNNNENMLIIHDPQLAQQYTAEFDRRFQDPRAEAPTDAELNCQEL